MKPTEKVVVPTKDGYDRWSDVYDEDGNPLLLLEEPHVARLLGDVRGLSVLDVGCGTGRHAIRFAQQGAQVTGVDFSAGMLGKARQKAGAEQVC
ncbi:MAG TPA: methyltransferase domain-containing protein, partial [Terriglobia bacterium]|nr:methyltransferase domain-containing protein [Terriglobia bacterium]